MTTSNLVHLPSAFVMAAFVLGCASSGSLRNGRYYTGDRLLSLKPPLLRSLKINDGYERARDVTTGYKGRIGWIDFESADSFLDVGMYSVEWMNISVSPIRDSADFYARASWYMDSYLNRDYPARFDGSFKYKELRREKIAIAGRSALRVVLFGPYGSGTTMGVVTILDGAKVIVNVQCTFSLPEAELDRSAQSAHWTTCARLVESIRVGDA
jgi:hypothetical protein